VGLPRNPGADTPSKRYIATVLQQLGRRSWLLANQRLRAEFHGVVVGLEAILAMRQMLAKIYSSLSGATLREERELV
jgi:hypothetical protein